MSIRSEWIWMDGEWIPYDEAQVHVLSHTLHYGLGVFEGIRSYTQDDGSGGIFQLEPHLRRFYDSARMCELVLPFSKDTLEEACIETLKRNCVWK